MRAPLFTRLTRRLLQLLAATLLLAMVSARMGINSAEAAVTLIYFRASSVSNGVFLEWETASELDNLGFFINRSTSPEVGTHVYPISSQPAVTHFWEATTSSQTRMWSTAPHIGISWS